MPSGEVCTRWVPEPWSVTATNRPSPKVTEIGLDVVAEDRRVQVMPSGEVMMLLVPLSRDAATNRTSPVPVP